MRKLRLVVVDDHPGFLNLLMSLLEIEFDVVGTAVDGESALEQIYLQRPDLVVLDLGMRLNGIEVTRELAKNRPGLPVVICAIESDPETVQAAQEAGALGYVFKLKVHKDLIPAVKSVIQGKPFVSSRSLE
jgi:DNA-binding NarL/FixJ family response regulator